jgi:hypothetical protein
MGAAVGALRVALGGLFLWAAATKVPDMGAFAESVSNYRLLPAGLVPVAAAAVVGIELAAGALLVAGRAVRGAALVLAGLLLVFTAGLAQALLRGIDLRCGCFGGAEPATWWTVGRDVAMLAAAVVVGAAGRRRGGAARAEAPGAMAAEEARG